MSDQPAAQREFHPVTDPGEAKKLIWEGARTFATAMIWSHDQIHVINTHLTLFSESEKTLIVWTPKEVDPAALMDDLAQRNERDLFFSVSLPRANIFFKAALQGYDTGGLRFSLPEKIFKVQRRKDLRFPIPDGHILKVEFEDPIFPSQKTVLRALDISASGIALLVDTSDVGVYTPGLIIKAVKFSIPSRKIECEIEVRHTAPMPVNSPKKGYKVGFLFRNIRAADTQAIASYVFEESRKYFSRLL